VVRSWPESATSASRAPCAAKWSGASRTARPVDAASRADTFAPKPGGALMPVPTAVPPIGSSPTAPSVASTAAAACATWLA
jgi:hypothetical protein